MSEKKPRGRKPKVKEKEVTLKVLRAFKDIQENEKIRQRGEVFTVLEKRAFEILSADDNYPLVEVVKICSKS